MIIKKGIIYINIIILIFCICGCSKINNSKVTISDERKVINEELVDNNLKDDYYGYLIIPKLNMNLEFYNVDNEKNDVNKNIQFIPTNIDNTYLLAGHSGTGKRSYFTSLKDLVKGDLIFLKIENQEIKYQVNDIKKIPKTGKITIRNKENMLILTTCDQVIKGYQLIIEAEVI